MPPADINSIPDYSTALALELTDNRGLARRIADFRGHNLIVYFYPMDDTPGCTVEAKEFRDSFEQFEALDFVIVGGSTDSANRHQAFAENHGCPFILLPAVDSYVATACAC